MARTLQCLPRPAHTMKLERHVGGLSKARKLHYLRARGWEETAEGCSSPATAPLAFPLARAVHHQLTDDLCKGLASSGWKVVGYTQRGYAKLQGPGGEPPCSLPKALRTQARREKR